MHEEIFAGKLSDALNHFRNKPPKGEFTLVIRENSSPAASQEDDSLAARVLRSFVSHGVPTSSAVRAVAELFDVKKNRLKQLALDFKQEEDQERDQKEKEELEEEAEARRDESGAHSSLFHACSGSRLLVASEDIAKTIKFYETVLGLKVVRCIRPHPMTPLYQQQAGESYDDTQVVLQAGDLEVVVVQGTSKSERLQINVKVAKSNKLTSESDMHVQELKHQLEVRHPSPDINILVTFLAGSRRKFR
eukprot:768074-Hanusia_phi.AAC.7